MSIFLREPLPFLHIILKRENLEVSKTDCQQFTSPGIRLMGAFFLS